MPRLVAWAGVIGYTMVWLAFKWKPPLRPGSDLAQGVLKRPPLLGELVFYANGGGANHPPGHQVLGLQGSKAF